MAKSGQERQADFLGITGVVEASKSLGPDGKKRGTRIRHGEARGGVSRRPEVAKVVGLRKWMPDDPVPMGGCKDD